MTEFRHQVPGSSEEVESSELYIPDDSDVGSGEFTVTLKPKALSASKVFWATILHPPKLQVTATFDPSMNVTVQLGLGEVLDRKNFQVPASADPEAEHKLLIKFLKWKLTGAFLDGNSM